MPILFIGIFFTVLLVWALRKYLKYSKISKVESEIEDLVIEESMFDKEVIRDKRKASLNKKRDKHTEKHEKE